MIDRLNYFFIFFILILPITLITGPAIPDLTVTFSVIFFLFSIFIHKSYKHIYNNIFVRFSIIYWFFFLFISLFAENVFLAYRDSVIFVRYLALPIFLIFLIFNNNKYLKISTGIIFFSVTFVCIDTLYQFINYDPEFGFGKDLLGFTPDWYGRLTGPFYKELIPGSYVSKFGLIGLVYLIVNIKNKTKQSIASITYLTMIGIVTFASGERMAFATFLLGILFLLIFYQKKRVVFFLSLLLIFFMVFLINKIHPVYNDYKILESTPYHLGLKIEKEYICNDSSEIRCKKIIYLQPRFIEVIKNFKDSPYGQIYKVGIKMFYDHKLQGVGMNNFTYLCKNDDRYKNLINNYDCPSHPHNIYLQWMVETGIFGLIFFLVYLYFVINNIFTNNFNNYSLISLSTLLILFWPIMSTGSLLKNWNGISTFFIIGICLALSNLKQKNE